MNSKTDRKLQWCIKYTDPRVQVQIQLQVPNLYRNYMYVRYASADRYKHTCKH